MKRVFYTFIFTLMFIMFIGQAASYTLIHDWTTPQAEQNENDPITGHAQKWSITERFAGDRYDPDAYQSSAFGLVSLSISAELLSVGEEINVVSWAQAISDNSGPIALPSKDRVHQNKTERDSEGRSYFHDSKTVREQDNGYYGTEVNSYAVAATTSYKAHPVAVYSDDPLGGLLAVGDRIERSFYHDVWAYAIAGVDGSENLKFLPRFNQYATGYVDVSSRSAVNLPINLVSFTTPD